MIKSIKYFQENCIKKFEKLENDFLREPTKMAEYVLALESEDDEMKDFYELVGDFLLQQRQKKVVKENMF